MTATNWWRPPTVHRPSPRSASTTGEFDLLLTDVKMPGDGTASSWRWPPDARHPDVAIMLMTGYADQRERSHALDALVHDVIGKPFTLEQIQGAVREALVARH